MERSDKRGRKRKNTDTDQTKTLENFQDVDMLSLNETKYHLTQTNNDIQKMSSNGNLRNGQIEQLKYQLTLERMKKARILTMINELEQHIEKLKTNKSYLAQDFPSKDSYMENMAIESTQDTNYGNNFLALTGTSETSTSYEIEKKMFIDSMLAYKRRANIKNTSPLLDGYLEYIPQDIESMVGQGEFVNTDANLHSPRKNDFQNNQKQSEVINIECSENKVSQPTWKILEEVGGLRRDRVLLDGLGHCYTLRRRIYNDGSMLWNCSKAFRTCNGMIKQIGNSFHQMKPHKCEPTPNLEANLRIEGLAEKIALDKKFECGADIVKVVAQEFANRGLAIYPWIHRLTKRIRLQRLTALPPHPKDLWFDIDMNFIPDNFLKGEVVVRHKKLLKRHLIFSTDRQKDLLGIATRWYLDLTYNMIDEPFLQIFVINVIIPNSVVVGQIPLAFILMSRTTTKDFKRVFEKLFEIFEQDVHVEELVCDYQTSLWQAAKTCFPYATVTGCGYHWFQDVWRAVKRCGLYYRFTNNKEVQKVCLRLLHLYLLPSKKIPKIFSLLREKASKLDVGGQSSQLTELFSYVETTWINNPTWPIDTWSMFEEPFRNSQLIRHVIYQVHRMKKLNFYALVAVFFEQDQRVPSDVKNPLGREGYFEIVRSTKNYEFYLRHIDFYWTEYKNGKIKALKLLKICADMFFNKNVFYTSFKFCSNPDDKKSVN